jgi:Leucine-rich repeat (LRR) protein
MTSEPILKNMIVKSSLDLSERDLEEIPKEVLDFFIEKLNVNGNSLTCLPKKIGQLVSLKILQCGGNKLTSLPCGIGQLVNLKELYISDNQLTSLPSEIGNLVNLKEFDVADNQLTSLLSEIGNLVNLEKFDAAGNQLTSLPHEIGQLVNLKELNVFNNQLTSLPSDIGKLVNLEQLVVTYNHLTSLPSEIGKLVNLKELYVSNNRLTSLPPEIGKLVNLEILYVFRNQLTSLPSEIGKLVNLKELDVSYNHLTFLPTEIGQLVNLKELNTSMNNLTSFPSEIEKLVSLKKLGICCSLLSYLPKKLILSDCPTIDSYTPAFSSPVCNFSYRCDTGECKTFCKYHTGKAPYDKYCHLHRAYNISSNESKECAVCLSTFDDIKFVCNECGNFTCFDCLENLSKCPYCRQELKVYEELKIDSVQQTINKKKEILRMVYEMDYLTKENLLDIEISQNLKTCESEYKSKKADLEISKTMRPQILNDKSFGGARRAYDKFQKAHNQAEKIVNEKTLKELDENYLHKVENIKKSPYKNEVAKKISKLKEDMKILMQLPTFTPEILSAIDAYFKNAMSIIPKPVNDFWKPRVNFIN